MMAVARAPRRPAAAAGRRAALLLALAIIGVVVLGRRVSVLIKQELEKVEQ